MISRYIYFVVQILFTVAQKEEIRVLTNIVKIEEYDGLTSEGGAHLIDDRQVQVTDISICMRFQYKLVGFIGDKDRLITISSWREKNVVQ
jgi:hypothetical protein